MQQRKQKLRGFATGISLGFVVIYDKKKVKSQSFRAEDGWA